MNLFKSIILFIFSLCYLGCNISNQERLQLRVTQKQQQEENLNQPAPLTATYDSINKNIFQVTCKNCHDSNGSGKRVPLDKESLLDSPLLLIDTVTPDESGLLVAFRRTDDKRMPPAKEGYMALSDEAIAIVRQWIENGAKD